ncbi:B12-binding domain-containing protein [Marimonas sp. MJW-29]|uniref:B12-binding domain-containing protein n=1 Tax=Sulfitobacter sediminis TaxID=3234186 RepID=A0ABV3RTK4_9RHOB
MSPPEDESDLVRVDLYHRSYSDLNRLQKQLPEEIVVSLAREVLEGLARQLASPEVRNEEILRLSNALIGPEPKAAASLIQRLYADGRDVNALYLEYLAPAALELGERWKSDRITFADVTVGTGRIYAIMRSLRKRITPHRTPGRRSAFFAVVPGDDHTLGLKMAADLARNDGWEIELELSSEHEEVLDRIIGAEPLLIGLSAGGKHAVPNLARLVLALRVHLPTAQILVSGNILDAETESVHLMHVDGIGRSYEEAMSELERLWQVIAKAQ